MRKKAERQYPLDFAGTQRLTKEWYADYRGIDAILNANPAVVDLVHADLEQGLKKAKRNVEGVASETILRMAIVQRLEDLSMRDLIVVIDDSQMLRFFCKFYDDALISHCQYAKLVKLIQPATWEKIHEVIVRYGRDKKKIKGEKLRLDTTAVETDIHYPTDSWLLFDCIRTLAHLIQDVREVDRESVGDGRTHLKKAKHTAFELARGGAKLHKAKQKSLYQRLLDQAEHLRNWGLEIAARIANTRLGGNVFVRLQLQQCAAELKDYAGLRAQCIHQARERVICERQVPNDQKIFSIFEPHTELLKRGKVRAEVEFGHMVELHEVEGGLISSYTVHEKRPAEPALLAKATLKHQALFGRVPAIEAGDKGFYSKEAVAAVEALGVKKVCVPKKGKRNEAETRHEHSIWFKLGQAFRAGIEGTISVLKRVFGLKRCLREGFKHFASWVGSGVLAHNLVALARL